MLRIRLSRVGKKKQPSYRLVVADSRAPRDGAFIKIIGHYNPRTDPTTLVVKEDEAVEWLSRGAQPSDTVAKLLTRIGVMERAGRAPVVWDRKTPVKPKKAPAEEAPAAAPVDSELASAERLTRIIVSDIILYDDTKFQRAVKEGNVLEAFENELTEAKALFHQRVPEKVRSKRDFLSEELQARAEKRRQSL